MKRKDILSAKTKQNEFAKWDQQTKVKYAKFASIMALPRNVFVNKNADRLFPILNLYNFRIFDYLSFREEKYLFMIILVEKSNKNQSHQRRTDSLKE